MTKAILIVDMPSCCTHCKFCNDETGFCMVLSKWVNNISNTRDHYCPLKPMPEKKEIDGFIAGGYSEYLDRYCDGWNDCIDEILGGTNNE